MLSLPYFIKFNISLLAFALLAAAQVTSAADVASPDGKLHLTFELGDQSDAAQAATYKIDYEGKPLIANSRIRFRMGDGSIVGENLKLASQTISQHDSTWKPVYGERSVVRDHYRQLTVKLNDEGSTQRTIEITFRAYNAGVAWRVKLADANAKGPLPIEEELTEFTFTEDYTAWVTRKAQGIYTVEKVSTLGNDVERPLTLRSPAGNGEPTYVAIAEAGLVDYARMNLRRSEDNPLQIVSQLHSAVKLASPATTPWRVVMVGKSAGELLENNDIILNLSEPCAIADTSWIKPGKVIREITLTDQGAQACIEFAVKHKLQYVEFDAGWYGHEYDDASDATTITVDPKRSAGPLDLKRHIKNANARGLGVILYVNRRALEKQLDELLPLFKSWGVAGVKYGFVRVGSQKWTAWLHEAIRKAADHELMVDVHDEYRGTGYFRTYPNLMTVEGIGGDETSPTNRQTLIQIFTRLIAGAADNKICYFSDRVTKNQNHAAQLAKAVMMYDPWQFLFWYDTPAASVAKRGKDHKTVILETPELEFWDHMPTVWDDSQVLHGEIGQSAVIARRSGSEWYVGALNTEATKLTVPLNFLKPGKSYVAHIYSHNAEVETPTHVKIERWTVDSDTTLRVELGTNSGQAMRIVPAKKSGSSTEALQRYPSAD